jgi:hypothetical protein
VRDEDVLVEKKYLRKVPIDLITETASQWEIVPPPEDAAGGVY